jgi:hypothetical protein
MPKHPFSLPRAQIFIRKHCCKKLSSATFDKISYLALLKAKISKGNIVEKKISSATFAKIDIFQFAASQPDVALEEVACAWLNHYTRVTFQVVKGTLLK